MSETHVVNHQGTADRIAGYTQLVETMMNTARKDPARPPRPFRNRGVDFARVVVNTMLDNAQNEIWIVAREVCAAVYDPEKIRAFLRRSTTAMAYILVEDTNATFNEASALHSLLPEIEHGRIEVKYLDGVQPNHFFVADRLHVRLENSQDTREAVVSFGDRDYASVLLERFENLSRTAVDYQTAITAHQQALRA